MRHNVEAVSRQFQILGDFVCAEPYGTGHINDTYAATYDQGGTTVRYIHQRVNHRIFKDPVTLMESIQRVTRHIRDKLVAAGEREVSRKTLTVIPSREGLPYYRDEQGNYWRTYIFVEKGRTYDSLETPEQAYEAAKAFGQFQRMLVDLPGPRLPETIPDFHHTPKRFETFESVLAADAHNRAKSAKSAIDFALRQKPWIGTLVELQRKGEIPERITHNDTKINNVIVDDTTKKGICVIDLDTIMPGLVLYDFGDMVRTATSPTAEDETDLSKVYVRMPMFEALARGYISTAGEFLTPVEKRYLPFAGRLITFTIGLRFLTDYLAGDVYFKVHREGQNLDRARSQFKLVESIMELEEEMGRLVGTL